MRGRTNSILKRYLKSVRALPRSSVFHIQHKPIIQGSKFKFSCVTEINFEIC